MSDNNNNEYQDKLCKFCKLKDTCKKDKIIVNRVSDKTTSILCYSYEYEKM